MDEVGEHVRRVRQKDEPRGAEREQLCDGVPAAERDVEQQREDERQPGEAEVPDEVAEPAGPVDVPARNHKEDAPHRCREERGDRKPDAGAHTHRVGDLGYAGTARMHAGELAVAHASSAAGRARGQARVVRRDDHGRAVLGSEIREQVDDLPARRRVEVAGRLVGEHDARLDREGACDRDALLLAARQMRGQMVRALGQPDLGEQLERAFARPTDRVRASPRRSRPR